MRAELPAGLTVFHSTADSEVKHLVDLGFRVLAGVVPEADPQAPPGACYLRHRRACEQGPGQAPAPGTSHQRPWAVGRSPCRWCAAQLRSRSGSHPARAGTAAALSSWLEGTGRALAPLGVCGGLRPTELELRDWGQAPAMGLAGGSHTGSPMAPGGDSGQTVPQGTPSTTTPSQPMNPTGHEWRNYAGDTVATQAGPGLAGPQGGTRT